ncbi:MAG: deoxyribose-phosphate aldolase [Gemmatimonadales bacterium]
MNEREMDQIATLVVEKLGSRHVGTRYASPQPAAPAPPASHPPIPGDGPSCRRVADFVDHTLLKAEATQVEIEKLCAEAAEHRFAAVCVNGSWVPLCAGLLHGTGVDVATVVGFPLGAMTSKAKAFEADELVGLGATEVDMVIALGHVIAGDWDYVEDEIGAVVAAAAGKTVKVILESAALEPLQVVKASAIAMEAGAHYVKTSTGFHPSGGATAEAVALMRLAVGNKLGVKASGGVRDCASALRMIAAGATRIGTSSGVKLVKCIGAGPMPLDTLLADPDRHDRVCLSH